MSDQAAFDAILRDLEAGHDWLLSLVTDPTGSRHFIDKSAATRTREFREQLARTAAFLHFLGDPQNAFKSVHIAGTSGKGSVTAMIAALLTAAGRRTAHHVSPYLQTPVEKLVLNGRPIRPSDFAVLVSDFRARHAEWAAGGGDLRYGEAWVALTLWWMARQRIDWGVVETGMGGRFDPTNVLPSALAVITNVDYDHVKPLGPGLAEIAGHKAGVIKPGGLALTAATRPLVRQVLRDEADAVGAQLFCLGDDFDFTVQETTAAGSRLTVETRWGTFDGVPLGLPGRFQALNAATAVAAVALLAGHHPIPLTATAVRTALADFRFPGRLEVVQRAPLVVLDGAHNGAKMRALAESLPSLGSFGRVTAVVGTLVSKEAGRLIDALSPRIDRFIITEPAVLGKPALPAAELAAITRRLAPDAPVQTASTVGEAIEQGLAGAAEDDLLLVTGSLYLVGDARERWFPVQELLRRIEREA